MEKLYNTLRNVSTEQRDTQSEDQETLLTDSQDTHLYSRPRQRTPAWVNTVLLLVLFFFATTLGIWIGSQNPFNLSALCTSHVSRYSPVIHDVSITYTEHRFNGSLLKENIYRQDAGPEVDAAWQALGVDYRSVVVPDTQAAESGLLPDQVKINSKYGGGYPANVEGLHQLHCLNLLRKSLYFNYDYYKALGEGAWQNDDAIVKYHVSHCLDIIRQQLMCTIDLGILGQVWWDPSHPKAYVDFNTKHTCRNFEAVRKWAETHQAPAEVPSDYLEPPKIGDKIYEEIP